MGPAAINFLTITLFYLMVAPCIQGNSIRDRLEEYKRLLGKKEKEGIQKGCGNNPADIVFVLDESGSIWGPDFERQKNFVKDVVRLMDVGPNRTHIGVETFGTDVRVQFNLGQIKRKGDILSSIGYITQRRGQTYTFDALERMHSSMFSSRYSRPNVTHIAVVITDGSSEDSERTAQQAKEAKDKDITMFAIGVGPYIKKSELMSIASGEDYYYNVTNYSALGQLKKDLAWKACQITTVPPPTTEAPTTTTTTPEPTTTTTTPIPTTTRPQSIQGCKGRLPIDVVFSVSENAGVLETRESFGLVRRLVETLEMGPTQAQLGLAPRTCASTTGEIRLMDHDSAQGFKNQLERLLPRGVDVPSQLRYLTDRGFTTETGVREDSAKVAVIIVDGPIKDMASASELKMLARNQGIELVFVGVGNTVRKRQLQKLATDPENGVIMLKNYSDLPGIKNQIQELLCAAIINKLYGGFV